MTKQEQVRIVRDEALRLLDRKEHQHARIARAAFDLCILSALVLMLDFIVTLLEHGALPEQAALLAAAAVALSVSSVFLVHVVWTACDRLSAFPVLKLRSFVDDMARLLIYEAGVPSPAFARNHRQRLL